MIYASTETCHRSGIGEGRLDRDEGSGRAAVVIGYLPAGLRPGEAGLPLGTRIRQYARLTPADGRRLWRWRWHRGPAPFVMHGSGVALTVVTEVGTGARDGEQQTGG